LTPNVNLDLKMTKRTQEKSDTVEKDRYKEIQNLNGVKDMDA